MKINETKTPSHKKAVKKNAKNRYRISAYKHRRDKSLPDWLWKQFITPYKIREGLIRDSLSYRGSENFIISFV